MSKDRVLIFDFDGTLTDAEAEGGPYTDHYLQELATICKLNSEWVQARYRELVRDMLAHPEEFGWNFGGHIVAPANVDPYLRVTPLATELTKDWEPSTRSTALGQLYKACYTRTLDVPREGAAELLARLAAEPHAHIVTNSSPDAVMGKITKLAAGAPWGDVMCERVHGDAKKYVVKPDWAHAGIDATLELPGLPRPVLLQRPHYFEKLDALRAQAGVDWSQVTVIGDIFELDLALPLALGATVHLAANDNTPHYEIDFLRAHPRGQVAYSLCEVMA